MLCSGSSIAYYHIVEHVMLTVSVIIALYYIKENTKYK